MKVTGSGSKVSLDTPAKLTINVNLKATEDIEKASLKITESQGEDTLNIPAESGKAVRSQCNENLHKSSKSSDHLVLFGVPDAGSSFASDEENRPYHQYSEGKIGQASLANDRMFCDLVAADEACIGDNDDLDVWMLVL